jgi:hypothetical protein
MRRPHSSGPRLLIAALLLPVCCGAAGDGSREYAAVQARLSQGWNTWNANSVLSHVLLPEGLSVTVGLHSFSLYSSQYLTQAQAGGTEKSPVQVAPGLHAIDGSTSDLTITWQGIKARVQSADDHGDLVLLVTPLEKPSTDPIVDFEVGMLWNRSGQLTADGTVITARLPGRTVAIYGAGTRASDPAIAAASPYLSMSLASKAGLSTGHARTLAEIEQIIDRAQKAHEATLVRSGVSPATVGAVESALGWDTVYDPVKGRVISPVSRSWTVGWGGFILFDWDTFFAAETAGLFGRDLAYANIVEMLNETTPAGFVPNYSGARVMSLDRSEPPVGSIVVLDTYRRFRDPWLLDISFDRLLGWNRWWDAHRQVDGYLVLGSDPGNPEYERHDLAVNTMQGAKYESGLDNSPMYDDAAYDAQTHKMRLADVGLMSLYVADCDALTKIAMEIGRKAEVGELDERSSRYRAKLATMWDPERHLYFNRDLATGNASLRMSPTNFYPLLARVPTQEQAGQMVKEHLLNPEEFWGEWVIPSIARSDPAFKDQDYWRGRIWGPMNFLVYLGLRNYPFPGVRTELAKKSEALLMKEYGERRHIHENYNAVTGESDDTTASDPFYHWGALLGVTEILEHEAPFRD